MIIRKKMAIFPKRGEVINVYFDTVWARDVLAVGYL